MRWGPDNGNPSSYPRQKRPVKGRQKVGWAPPTKTAGRPTTREKGGNHRGHREHREDLDLDDPQAVPRLPEGASFFGASSGLHPSDPVENLCGLRWRLRIDNPGPLG